MRNSLFMQWMVQGNTFQVCSRTLPRLPAAAYTCFTDCYGRANFQAKGLQVDDLIEFPDSLSARILEEIERFWERGDVFRDLGFLHRRGYLFWGKQGCGKSSLIHQIVTRIIE